MTVDELDLVEPALTAAKTFQAAFPQAVFTSGRRTRASQAHAMASNIANFKRDWIMSVYVQSDARDACQAWIDANPQAVTVDDLAAGLQSVLDSFSDADLRHLSYHLSGLAFDVQPVPDVPNGLRMKAQLRKQVAGVPGAKFLEKEGGLVRWHAQFPAP